MSENNNEVPELLNLGCGDDYKEGYHNVDIRDSVAPDEVVNLDNYPWPWSYNSFSRILVDNVIEHLDDQLTALEELQRVTKPTGTIVFRFPHWNSAGAWSDPTHTTPVTRETFSHGLLEENFDVVNVDCTRVRVGKLLPKHFALFMADHVGQIVSEVEVTCTVNTLG